MRVWNSLRRSKRKDGAGFFNPHARAFRAPCGAAGVLLIFGVSSCNLTTRSLVETTLGVPKSHMEKWGDDDAYHNQSDGMAPALRTGDVVTATTEFGEVRRGDIVVFDSPPGASGSEVKVLIKRVVGLPGERIEGTGGKILINGQPLAEPYLPESVLSREFPLETIPPDSYWVLGDNRQDSRDSTFFKSIPGKSIVARVQHIYAPASRRGEVR